jgi:hypothetical protein
MSSTKSTPIYQPLAALCKTGTNPAKEQADFNNFRHKLSQISLKFCLIFVSGLDFDLKVV